jgi:hypothetical protein
VKGEIEERIKQEEGNSRTVFTAGGLQGRLCRSFLAIDLSDSAAEDLAASGVIASVAEDLVVAALADSAAAGSGADGEDNAWNFPVLFLEKLKPQTNHSKKRYEKTINTDRYRQYQHGPGTNIHIRSDCRQRE